MDKLVRLLLQFDTTGDRRIGLPELVQALQVVDKSVFDENFVKDAFGGAGEGLVDIPGFAAWITGKSDSKAFVERPEEQDFDELDLDTSAVDSMLSKAKSKFDELDKNHNGFLDPNELKDLCSWTYSTFGRKFKSDKDKNAAIEKQVKKYLKKSEEWDFDTFETYYQKLSSDIERYELKRSEAFEKGYNKSKAAVKFKELDTDGSGFLEGKELEVFATWIFESFHPDGKPLTEEKKQEEARLLVTKLTSRRDGNSDGKLSFTEVDFYIDEKITQIEAFKKRSQEREAKRLEKEAQKAAAKEAKKKAKEAKASEGNEGTSAE